jgi:hypothetical protein
MTYKNEGQLKKALEIDTWRNLSRDKMIKFVAMMPDMDKELALKVVEQFPDFARFVSGALDFIGQKYESALNHNKQSQEGFYQSARETREILKRELEKNDLTWEQKKYILDLIMETVKLESAKDSENKRFLDSMFGRVALVTAGVIAAGATVLGGGRVLAQLEESDD